MVLKFETDPDEVYFVESTANRGVSISRWSTVRRYLGDFYEQVVLRRLEIPRTAEMIARLEVFLKEAVGARYGMSTSKLLFHRSSIKPKHGAFIDEDRTFFCSELVAKAYKVLGVMVDDDRPCCQFYPSHFSSKNSHVLNLTHNASLGRELNIFIEGGASYKNEEDSELEQKSPSFNTE